MRQAHRAGEKLFLDYAGDTVPVIVDRLTGETRRAQIFVAVLELWPKLGDGDLREAAYRGGWKPA
jgi:hypothetical protein